MAHLIHDLPMDRYAADDVGAPTPTLNSSLANRLIDRSARHAYARHPKYGGLAPDVNDAMNIGSAAHAMLLEDRDIIATIPYDDWRTARAKEMREEATAARQIPLLRRDADAVRAMVEVARLKLDLCPDLEGLGPTDSELTLVWEEERFIGTAWLRARPDLMSRDRTILISYKTTRSPANPDRYVRTITDAGHHVQAAFEIAGVEAVFGTRVTHYVWLVQEVEPPFACSLIGLSSQMRHLATARMDVAIDKWIGCQASREWPGYPERICYVDPPAWAMREIEEGAEA